VGIISGLFSHLEPEASLVRVTQSGWLESQVLLRMWIVQVLHWGFGFSWTGFMEPDVDSVQPK
jgi:UDP-N-acetylmuramyl pentapeptide phosphotransferase/UDP-N-acetylglucosamine-1-phosphate transferase